MYFLALTSDTWNTRGDELGEHDVEHKKVKVSSERLRKDLEEYSGCYFEVMVYLKLFGAGISKLRELHYKTNKTLVKELLGT